MEDEDGSLLDGQPPERAFELIPVRNGAVFVRSVRGLEGPEADGLGPPTPTPSLRVALVGKDAVEPRLEAVGIPQRAEILPGGQQGRLDGVVSKVEVAEDPERDRHASVAGQTGERIEGLSIAASRLFHQLCVHRTLLARVFVAPDLGTIERQSVLGHRTVQSVAAKAATPAGGPERTGR
jgi:hypothetical protein